MTITHPRPHIGDLVRTATGYYLVEGFGEPDEFVTEGYVLARRAERPMTHSRSLHPGEVLEVVDHPDHEHLRATDTPTPSDGSAR